MLPVASVAVVAVVECCPNAAQRTHPGAGVRGKDAGARLASAWWLAWGGLVGWVGVAWWLWLW